MTDEASVTGVFSEKPKLRQAFGAFATGVTVVTAYSNEQDAGLTVNSFSSVSIDPPLVLWSLSRESLSLPTFMAAEFFAVHILSLAQQSLSDAFARRGPDKFRDLQFSRGLGGSPLLQGCAARFQCRTSQRYEGGDHVIFVGEVVEFNLSGSQPLIFHAGRYAIAAPRVPASVAMVTADSGISDDFLIHLLGHAHHHLFMQLRGTLQQQGMTEADWYCLSTLSNLGPMSIADLGRRLSHSGFDVTYDRIAGLASAELLTLDGGHDPDALATLTARGRQAVLELVAAAKDTEATFEQQLGSDETRVLKQWLRQLIAHTRTQVPTPGSDNHD